MPSDLMGRLEMHARDCVRAADMDTDAVLSKAQIDVMADDLREAATHLRAVAGEPATPVSGESVTGRVNGYLMMDRAMEVLADAPLPTWITKNPNVRVTIVPTPNPEQPEGKGMKVGDTIMVPAYVAYPGSRVSDLLIGGRDGPFVQVPNSMLAAAPAAPGVRVDEASVLRVARALADRSAACCNVNPDDNWKVYSEDFIADARAALAAIKAGA